MKETTIEPNMMSYSSYIVSNEDGKLIMGFVRLIKHDGEYVIDAYTRDAKFDGKFKFRKDMKDRVKLAIRGHDDATILLGTIVSEAADVMRINELVDEMMIPHERLQAIPYIEAEEEAAATM